MTHAAQTQEPGERKRELLGRLRLSLPRLDALLRAEGFVGGPDRWQNVYDLLVEFQARGRLPARTAALRPLLAPLFCRNADEQVRFARVFETWLDEVAQEPGAVPERAESRRKEPRPEPPPKPSLGWWIVGLVLGALALAAVSYVVIEWYVSQQEAETPAPLPSPPPRPIPEPGSAAQTDEFPKDLEPQPVPPRTPLEQPQLNPGNQALVRTTGLLVMSLPAFGLMGLLFSRWLSWSRP